METTHLTEKLKSNNCVCVVSILDTCPQQNEVICWIKANAHFFGINLDIILMETKLA